MHYFIEYENLESDVTKRKALQDCKDFLGARKFKEVSLILANDHRQTSKHIVLFGLSLTGIEGYPAEVMLETYWK